MSKTDDARVQREAAAKRRASGSQRPDQTVGYINALRVERGAELIEVPSGPYVDDGGSGEGAPIVRGAVVRKPLHPKVAAAIERTRGRPTRAEKAGQPLTVKLSPEERARLSVAAEAVELPLSVWAREVLLREAGK